LGEKESLERVEKRIESWESEQELKGSERGVVLQECWRFLAKPLKIEFESIPNVYTRNVLGIS
jgi:hypothetical protein